MRPFTLFPALAAGATLLAGCGWSNPYDTREDEAAYEAKKRQDLERDALPAYQAPPQEPENRLAAAELEAWRDTVLAAADDDTLQAIRAASLQKIGRIEARVADLVKQDPHSAKVAMIEAQSQLRTEKQRLAMVESRIKSGQPRRAD